MQFMNDIIENFFIRTIKQDDSQRIWEIRNHPMVRENSNGSEIIDFEKHDAWFQKKYFSGSDNHCYILEKKAGYIIGYCRYDYNSQYKAYLISIALDPEYHGKGFGKYLLSESLKQFNKGDIVAEIKKENMPSVKLFQKNDFNIYDEDDINYYLKFKQN